ncbi:SDR family NAD(P)-dependent oxidoreductase [Telluria aromaticivorans]|uniref:NADP-dependent 3-hydroxy acid dehydrogenase YdfG n=1 Tax=Telluria aromaticivorans TaxID=2725995 RepID=A0A7Y2JUW5_9BURK|nr:SDR family oxidoreductase [Telluria aromaticivorans]NNG21435.1 SDR family oxidoreductase [Telluria aromaticivorans]
MNQSIPGTAVITGASTGIGALYAERLAARGYDLVLVARNGARLLALSARLQAETGRTVRAISADLTSPDDLRRIETLLREDSSISMLVNNAGVGATAPLLASDVDKMEEMIGLNVTALTRLTYAAAPGFAARGQGTIVNIASIVAIAPEILNGVYGASKAYVLALSQSLQHELGDKGVRVQAVLPGATATDFWSLAGTPVEHLPQEIVMRADAMVDAALAGLDQGELVTIPGLEDGAKYRAYEAARRAMHSELSTSTPASRYRGWAAAA